MSNWTEIAKTKALEKGTKFTPPDIIFADAEGHVIDANTPKILLGATLCDRFTIERYIESGAFGPNPPSVLRCASL